MRIVALLVAPAYHPFHRCESIDQYWMPAVSLTELHGPTDQLRREYSRGFIEARWVRHCTGRVPSEHGFNTEGGG